MESTWIKASIQTHTTNSRQLRSKSAKGMNLDHLPYLGWGVSTSFTGEEGPDPTSVEAPTLK